MIKKRSPKTKCKYFTSLYGLGLCAKLGECDINKCPLKKKKEKINDF